MASNLENKLNNVPLLKRKKAEEMLIKGDLALNGKFNDIWGYHADFSRFTHKTSPVPLLDTKQANDRLVFIKCQDKYTGTINDYALHVFPGIVQKPGVNQLISRPRFCLYDLRRERMTDGWCDGFGTLDRSGQYLLCTKGVLDPTKTVCIPNPGRHSIDMCRILSMNSYAHGAN